MIGKDEFEVVTFRTDGNYSDGRRPDSVEFSTMEEDCKRRDFTINGMYYDPLTEGLIDLVGGQADIEAKIIRFIGEPIDRINEDALRIIRAVRFSTRLGFDVDMLTAQAVIQNAHMISSISAERITDEMNKMFSDSSRVKAMQDMKLIGLLNNSITSLDVFEKLPEDPSNELCWAALIEGSKYHSIHDKEAILNKFYIMSISKVKHIINIIKDVSLVNGCVDKCNYNWANLKRFVRKPHFKDSLEFYRIAEKISNSETTRMMIEAIADNSEFMSNLNPAPLITGDDLVQMGVVRGPVYKIILEAVETEQLNGTISTVAEAKKIVKDIVAKR